MMLLTICICLKISKYSKNAITFDANTETTENKYVQDASHTRNFNKNIPVPRMLL